MIDISEKIETLRIAIAESKIIAKKETIDRAVKGDTPKGEVFPIARAAAVLAAKKTDELIPYCHPLALDAVHITFEPKNSEILIRAEVKAIGRTGVEMEALVAVSIAALTVYDMLKGIDKDVVIGETRLIEKKGGKSDFQESFQAPLKTAVLVTSDSVSAGKKADKSGKIIVESLKKFPVDVKHYEIIPDDKKTIQQKLLGWAEEGIQLILTTGGTGLGPRDVTVEAVSEIIEREVPGIAQAMRTYGQRRTPYAMLSRGVVGVRGQTLFMTLPGSSNGVKESMAAIFPNVLHLFNMMKGYGH
ncbi:MAG: bifunctional molybdenum cofactor biosynthesis protein MoaC/MoaB [Deltaproteobacteria bacterium]|nr:bifunctional molybdenum cofactor biosynthesis protein MoaC/MoaB [Deltaproteobacteria bacterium]